MENLTNPTISLNHNWCNSTNLVRMYDAFCVDVEMVRGEIWDVREMILSRRARQNEVSRGGKEKDVADNEIGEDGDEVESGEDMVVGEETSWEVEWEQCVGELMRQNSGWKYVLSSASSSLPHPLPFSLLPPPSPSPSSVLREEEAKLTILQTSWLIFWRMIHHALSILVHGEQSVANPLGWPNATSDLRPGNEEILNEVRTSLSLFSFPSNTVRESPLDSRRPKAVLDHLEARETKADEIREQRSLQFLRNSSRGKKGSITSLRE